MESRRIEPRCQKERAIRGHQEASAQRSRKEQIQSQRTVISKNKYAYSVVAVLIYSRQVYRQPNPKTRKKVANEDPWRVQHFDLQGGADQMLKQIT